MGRLAWRSTLGVRIVAILLAVSCTSGAIGGWIDYRDARANIPTALHEKGTALAKNGASACPDKVVPPGDLPALEDQVEDLVRSDKEVVFAIVVRADGRPLAAFPRGSSPIQNATTYLSREPILVEAGGEQLGTFYVGLTTTVRQAELRERTVRMIFHSSLGFLIVGAVLWFALRALVVTPLRRLDAQAQRLGSGDLEAPLPHFGSTELGRLGRTLDEMRVNLRNSHASLAAQNRQLLELDRLKSQFLANVSHEMRTPLTSILGEAELLAEQDADNGDERPSATAIQRNGTHLLALVDQLLDLAKLESNTLLIEKRPCQPAEIIATTCSRFAEAATAKGIMLRVNAVSLAAMTMRTDPSRLRQMVSYIVDNAIKFTSRGSVAVTAQLSTDAGGQRLLITVTDTGIGIAPSFLEGGIGAFRQEDGSLTRQQGGSGLGLYMTQEIARSLGGELTIASNVGRGTRIDIQIPVDKVITAAPTLPAAARGRGRVLVVDDARDNQHLLKAMITKLGHEVELADNGRIAIDRMVASRDGQPFDLVIMDLQMPELDGISAIRELRALGFDVPIVSLTAHALADDRERCLAAGASGYETKPISRQRLNEVVATHLRPQPTQANAAR